MKDILKKNASTFEKPFLKICMAKALVYLFNIQYEVTKIDRMLHKINSCLRKHSLHTLKIVYAMQPPRWQEDFISA